MATPQLHRFTADNTADFIINAPDGEMYDERVLVFVDGVKLQPVVDYTRTATSITLLASYDTDQVLEINPVGGTSTVSSVSGDTTINIAQDTTDVSVSDASD